MTSSTLIIPDIHGRTFWRTPVLAALNDPQAPDIVFLGDYLDPYTYEGVTPSEAYCIFSEILNLKREHPHRIHLLLGNHDLGYIDETIGCCRRDEARAAIIRHLFTLNEPLFDIAWEKYINGKRFLFSHAGVNRYWACRYPELFGREISISGSSLNSLWHRKSSDPLRRRFMEALCDVSEFRGGHSKGGSMVWADVAEFFLSHSTLPDIIQVVGHTQSIARPLFLQREGESDFYCLDCHQAFVLDTEGHIHLHADGSEVLPMDFTF